MSEGYVSTINNPYDYFKLISAANISNMVLFDSENRIKKYENVK
jgi:DNA topoisomerase-2